MVSIHTNLAGMKIRQNLTKATGQIGQAIERLSTGYRINQAKDNAAGFHVANNILSKLNSYLIAEENITMGIDIVNTASDNFSLAEQCITRLREIVIQISNGTYSQDSIDTMTIEAEQIINELERIRTKTEYAGENVFVGDGAPVPVTVTKNIGLSSESTTEVEVPEVHFAKISDKLGAFMTFDADKEVEIIDKTGASIASRMFNENNTISHLLEFFRNNGVAADMVDGVISLNSSDGLYGNDVSSNGVLEQLGIDFVAGPSETVTIGTSTTSSDAVTYQVIGQAVATSQLGEVTGLSGSKNVVVKNHYGDLVVTQAFTANNTLGELMTFLGSYNITATLTDGVISLTSAVGNFVTDEDATGYISSLGISTNSNTVNKTIGLAQTSTIAISYKKEVYTIDNAYKSSYILHPAASTTQYVYRLYLYKDGSTVDYISQTTSSTCQQLNAQTLLNGINNLFPTAVYDKNTGQYKVGSQYLYYVIPVTAITEGFPPDPEKIIFISIFGSKTTNTLNATETTNLKTLGITSKQQITIINNDTQTILTFTTADTIGTIRNSLLLAGLDTSFSGGKLSILASNNAYIKGFTADLRNAFKLDNKHNTFASVTTYTNSNAGLTHSASVAKTLTTTDTLDKLGINSDQEIVVYKNQAPQTVSINGAKSVQEFINAMNNAGVATSLNNGIFTLTGGHNGYIDTIPALIISALKLGATPYYTTTTYTYNSNDNSDEQTQIIPRPATLNDKLGDVGLTNSQEITINNNGNEYTFSADTNDTLSELIFKIRQYGVQSSLNSGKLNIQGSNFSYIKSLGTDLSGVLKLTAPLYEERDIIEIHPSPKIVKIQAGIYGEETSKITFNSTFSLVGLDNVLTWGLKHPDTLIQIDIIRSNIIKKQTELGATANRLESALKSTTIAQETLTSSLSTIRDTDISEESTNYVSATIIQNACATLMATANQTPSIALALI